MSPATPPPRRFVVQLHRATARHYDLRLELGGVLVSWAVPKGPTLDPGVRRLAVAVEDHALSHLDVEGVLPGGGPRSGPGDVIVWDTGTWQPDEGADPAAELAAGRLHATLSGHKLRGRFVLLRTDRRPGPRGRVQWLLLHTRDEHAVPGWDPEDHPRSVLTGRTNDEVRAGG